MDLMHAHMPVMWHAGISHPSMRLNLCCYCLQLSLTHAGALAISSIFAHMACNGLTAHHVQQNTRCQ